MIRIANQPTQEELDNIYNSIIENFKSKKDCALK